jgi:hypothetical protein
LPPGQPITAQDMERLEQGSEWYRGLQRQAPTRKFPSLNNIWDK